MEREKAALGLFVTLAEPKRVMRREATAAGHFESPHERAVPKIQILTIENLLTGKKAQLPPQPGAGSPAERIKNS